MALLLVAPASAQVTLSVGIADEAYMDVYLNVFGPEFERRNPGVNVEFQMIGWTVDNYVVRYIGGSAPDVFQVGGDKLGSYLSMVTPLDRYTQGWNVLDDMVPGLVNAARLNGQLMGLPANYAIRQMTYRKDWFEESGLNADEPPSNWEEVVEYGRRLVRFGSAGRMTRQAYYTNNNMTQFTVFLAQAGGSWMSPDMTEATFADERGMEATQFVHSLYHEYNIADPTDTLGNLAQGGAAMHDITPSIWANPQNSPTGRSEDIGVAPAIGHVERAIHVMPTLWLMTDTSTQQDLAWQWLDFMFEIEQIVTQGEALSFIPTRISAAQYPPWVDNENWITTFENLQYGATVTMLSPHWDLMRREFQQPALGEIIRQGASPNIMVEAQRQANVWLQERLRQ